MTTRESALMGLLADLAADRDALIAQRDALKVELAAATKAANDAAMLAQLDEPPDAA